MSSQARNGRKSDPRLSKALCSTAKVVVEEATQEISPLYWPLSWWLVG